MEKNMARVLFTRLP